MDIRELVQKSLEAEQAGIPVNWKELAVTAVNVATQRVGQLEEQVRLLSPPEPTLPTLDDLES